MDLPKNDRVGQGKYPVVASTGIAGYHNKYQVDGPGVVIGRSGSIGGGQYIRGKFWPLNTTLWVKNFKGNEPRYCYYLLQSIDFKRFNVGTSVPTLNRNHIHPLPVVKPTLAVQQKVVSLLGGIDDHIQSLIQENNTLESIAQTLFRSWFVNFDPVHAKAAGNAPEAMSAELAELFPSEFEESALGLIPKGWSWQGVDHSITYLNGLALQKYPSVEGEPTLPVLKISQLRAGRTDPKILSNRKMKPEFIIKDGDIIFSWSGSLEVRIWTGGDAALNQHLFKVFSEKYPAWFCYQATQLHLPSFRETAASKATTMGHIQRHHLTEAKVAVCPSSLMAKLNDIFAPMQKTVVLNGQLIRELEQLRDHLLPRLISGKLSFDEAEKAVAELLPEPVEAI
jgi:type I restriction enzyme S subunit